MEENLQTNAFFAAMLDHIPSLERSCVEKRWILCIPQASALPESHRMSLRLLKMHVLIPQEHPGEYATLCPDVRVVRTNEGRDFEVIEGTAHRTVSITYSETIYCGVRADESYVAFCVARPFGGGGGVPTFPDGSEVFLEERSSEEWEEILFAQGPKGEEARHQLVLLERRIAAMDDPLQVVPGNNRREPKAYAEMRMFAERMTKETISFNDSFSAAGANPKFQALLQTAYESCAARAAHGIVFAALAASQAHLEDDVQMKLHDLRQLVLSNHAFSDKAGLTSAFMSRIDEAARQSSAFLGSVDALQAMNDQKTPLEKLWCIRDAGRLLKNVPGHTNMDDALPLFLLALLTAAPGLLLANLGLMSDFAPKQWVKSIGELSFHLTVFSGAVTVIQEHVPCQEDESSLFKNLVFAGGSGLGLTWIGGASTKPLVDVQSSSKKGNQQDGLGFLKIFESCAPQSRS